MNTHQYRHLYLEPYDPKRLANLCGYCGENLKLIEARLNVAIHSRGNFFEIRPLNGTSLDPLAAQIAIDVLESLYNESATTLDLTPNCVHLRLLEHKDRMPADAQDDALIVLAIESTAKPKPGLIRQNARVSTKAHQTTIPPHFSQEQPLTMEKPTSSNEKPSDNNTDKHSVKNTAKESQPDLDDPHRGNSNQQSVLAQGHNDNITEIHTHRKVIRLRSGNQKLYAKNMAQYDVNFGIGPAGTGKTYLAVAAAVNAFKNDEVKRILLVRPAVEAGEKLGFLPGDLSEKVNPYLRPLYDALYEMLGFEQVAKLIDRQIIEVCPLAYMRGRTLSDAFIILDESQNTTPAQMKMFLTRIGFGSKAVITGDITQIDLPRGQASGLHHALHVLKDVKSIGVTEFATTDVVRHPLVKAIIEAYNFEESQ